jgi:hypothetical protein
MNDLDTNLHPSRLNILTSKRFYKATEGLNRNICVRAGVTSGFFDDQRKINAIRIRPSGIRAIALLGDEGNVTDFSIEEENTLYISGKDTAGIVYDKKTDETIAMDDATKKAKAAWILEHAEQICALSNQRN